MAGRSSRRTCEGLLSKLKQGQDVLRKSIENIQVPSKMAATSQGLLSKRKLEGRSRDSLTIDLTRSSRFPKKRARLQQLSPDFEESPNKPLTKHPRTQLSSPSKHPSVSPAKPPSKNPRRRLSSTPIKSPSRKSPEIRLGRHSSSALPTPEVDLSLEEALFHESNKENASDSYTLPSPKLSQIAVDTGRNIMDNGGTKPALSSMMTSGQGKKKKRGLTVSFVQNDADKNADKNTCKPGTPGASKRTFTRHATQRNLDAGLVGSLNNSRYGAMERRYAQTRKEGTFPKGFPGEDPRLGYDWIAGLLDASESYLSEKDNEYFEDMKEFRRVNFGECHRPKEVNLLDDNCREQEDSDEDFLSDGDQKTTCVRSYVLNDRLFPMHVSSVDHAPGSACPACEDKPARLSNSNRYVRVSVPHSVLQPTSQFKPHRRRSFDPVDSMGLAKHCLAGWETARPCMVPPQPSLDLKSTLPKKDHHHFPEMNRCQESERGHNLLDTSHVIEYNLRSRAAKH